MNQVKKIKGAIHSQLPAKDLQSLVKEISNGHGHETSVSLSFNAFQDYNTFR